MLEFISSRRFLGFYYLGEPKDLPQHVPAEAEDEKWFFKVTESKELAYPRPVWAGFELLIFQHKAPNSNDLYKLLVLANADENLLVANPFPSWDHDYIRCDLHSDLISDQVVELVKQDSESNAFRQSVRNGLKNMSKK